MNKLLRNNNSFKTSDLALAATLSLCRPIKALERINSHKVYFIFKKDRELNELLKKYWKRELKVEPQEYFNQLKMIKTRIYATS